MLHDSLKQGNIISIVNTLWGIVVLVNVIITFGTVKRRLEINAPTPFTYLDNDRPLVLGPSTGIPIVEMQFHESSRFTFDTAEGVENWNTMWTNQAGIGFQHPPPYKFRAVSGQYHMLHCLNRMQIAFENPNHVDVDEHFEHCLTYWRQSFLCKADMTLEMGDFMKRNLTIDRVGENRRCRDWRAVDDWVHQEYTEWVESVGVTVAEVGELPAHWQEMTKYY